MAATFYFKVLAPVEEALSKLWWELWELPSGAFFSGRLLPYGDAKIWENSAYSKLKLNSVWSLFFFFLLFLVNFLLAAFCLNKVVTCCLLFRHIQH